MIQVCHDRQLFRDSLTRCLLRWELRMAPNWTPSIVPRGFDQTVYLVLDDFGRLGRAYRETDAERADLETTITDLISGQYGNPARVVAFNTAERWAEDAHAGRSVQHRYLAWRCLRLPNLRQVHLIPSTPN